MLSTRELTGLMEAVGGVVREYVAHAVDIVAKRINDVEQRLADLPAGPQGEPGIPGPPGESVKGDPGPVGADGRNAFEVAVSLGFEGDVYAWMESIKGDPGPALPGPPGDAGPAGLSAYDLALARGFEGDESQWLESLQGPPGKDGEPGAAVQGEKGEAGQSAYHVAVAKGFQGTEPEWLESLRGATGEPGPPGESVKGDQGPQGFPGYDGDSGKSAYEVAVSKGYAGTELQWMESLRGSPGVPGTKGDPGEKGDPGRDALDLDILPAIDETRSYPRGTFASHRGGLWRSHTTTDGMRGWECIVNGVADTLIAQVGERGFKIVLEMSNGLKSTANVTLPVMIHRGIFQPEADYEKGDVVTWAGSQWLCNTPCKNVKPGDGDHWVLVVKRGRDGKDGDPGAKGEKGETGRAGRDLTQLGPDGSKW